MLANSCFTGEPLMSLTSKGDDMGYKAYYRFMSIAPLVIVLLVLGPEWAMPQRQDEFGVHLGQPLYFGVVPYCIFFILFEWVALNKSYKHFMRAVWLSPIMLIPFALTTWVIMDYDKAAAIRDNFDLLSLLFVAIAASVIGYIYISITVGLCKLLSFVGCIKNPEPIEI